MTESREYSLKDDPKIKGKIDSIMEALYDCIESANPKIQDTMCMEAEKWALNFPRSYNKSSNIIHKLFNTIWEASDYIPSELSNDDRL